MGKQSVSAFFIGVIFGFGLCLSHMVDPKVVVGFLDVTGQWDPRLLFVMAGALLVTLIVFPFITRSGKGPVCESKFFIPEKKEIDRPLIIGAALFGIGWGLGGICPGPAVTVLAFGYKEAFIFLWAMVLGMIIYHHASAN